MIHIDKEDDKTPYKSNVPVTHDPVVRDSEEVHINTPGRTLTRPNLPAFSAAKGELIPTDRVSGKASWYCKAGVSICHYAYPPGSMVAAACGKLRSAMGPGWRGTQVTVTSGSRSVEVKLVDWCGSKDKLIDLYWEPMRRLGGTGVLQVTVSW